MLFLFCLTEMDGCQQAYRPPPSIHGLFPGLKKCPPDTFLLRLRSAALFESTIRTKKRGGFCLLFSWCGRQDSICILLPSGSKIKVRLRQAVGGNSPPDCCNGWVQVQYFLRPKEKEGRCPSFSFGAGDRTRTCTLSQRNLNPPSLPIPPRPHILLCL